jgi:hypothetical protein
LWLWILNQIYHQSNPDESINSELQGEVGQWALQADEEGRQNACLDLCTLSWLLSIPEDGFAGTHLESSNCWMWCHKHFHGRSKMDTWMVSAHSSTKALEELSFPDHMKQPGLWHWLVLLGTQGQGGLLRTATQCLLSVPLSFHTSVCVLGYFNQDIMYLWILPAYKVQLSCFNTSAQTF